MFAKLIVLICFVSSTLQDFPAFTYVASEWPSVAASTDGLGYSVAPATDATISSKYTLSTSYSNIAVNAAKNTQNCSLFTNPQTLGSSGTCYWPCSGNDPVNCLRSTDISTCSGPKTMGLTFDDGPQPCTLTLLAYLQANNLKATFFMVGSRMVQYPEIVKAVVSAGMDIGVHTWSHHPLTSQSNDVVMAELGWTVKAFQAITGLTPKLMRPPQGDIDDRVRGIAAAMGLTPVLWNIDTQDWTTDSNASLQTSVINAFQTLFLASSFPSGVITLEHDYFQGGVDMATKAFIPFYKLQGYNMMSVSACKGLDSANPASPSAKGAVANSAATSYSNVLTLVSAAVLAILTTYYYL